MPPVAPQTGLKPLFHCVVPPSSEFDNKSVMKTIRENPALFKIVTPIQVDKFESYLISHPNPSFVQSVCQGLREGFWPWASTNQPNYLTTNDESSVTPVDIKKADFLQTQKLVELTKDRFSPSFGKKLLPGMYCMPIYAVPSQIHLIFIW
jgi:hypothetical protein